jgi:hypothetical protein
VARAVAISERELSSPIESEMPLKVMASPTVTVSGCL